MKASPRIGPAAPANKNLMPSAFHSARNPGLSCFVVVELLELEVEVVEEEDDELALAGGEERPTRFDGTRAGSVWRRTLSTSSLWCV